MSSNSYAPEIQQLFTLGEPDFVTWLDYASLGIGPEHESELLEIVARDEDEEASGDAVWAPVHAWRALGQLRSRKAAEMLLSRLDASKAEAEIERVYEADLVDETICGSWDEVQGALATRPAPRDPTV